MLLPLEIRIRIYHYAADANPLPDRHLRDDEATTFLRRGVNEPIMRVSRQIRNEALPVLFGCKGFTFSYPSDVRDFIDDLLDHHRAHIQKIHLHCYECHPEMFNALEIGCPSLQHFHICFKNCTRDQMVEVNRFYAEAKSWIYHIALAHRNKLAALDILDVECKEVICGCGDNNAMPDFKVALGTLIDQDAILESLFSITRKS